MQDVSKGLVSETLPAVQMIPPIMQLYPEVEVEHADDSAAIFSHQDKWTWFFAGRTLYLVAGERIMHHKDVAPLLAVYLREVGKVL